MRFSDRKDFLRTRKILLISAASLLLVLSILLYIVLGKTRGVYYELTEFVMGTRVRVYVAGDKMPSKILAQMAIEEFRRLDQKYDPYRPGSILYKINHSSTWTEVDEETLGLIKAAIGFAKSTEGAFDPALGRIIRLWGFDEFSSKNASELHVPSDYEIERELKRSGYDKIVIDSKNSRVYMKDGAWIDLGGMVKGYALERAYKKIKAVDKNATGFIDAGGDIRIIGPKFGTSCWTIGIKNPRGEGIVDMIYLKEGAVATSGDYERYFIIDGVRYHHIMDPKTGKPARGVWSVTVVAKDAVTADVLSTAGFVLGKDYRFVLLKFPELGGQVFMVLDGGKTVKSEGFSSFEKEK